jgi:hypothetical protein
MVGLPSSQLSDTYVLTRYNSTLNDLLPYVVIANADTATATITITIGGVLKETFNLSKDQGVIKYYANTSAGPVVVQSTNGKNIIASLLQLRRPDNTPNNNTGWTGITQFMGLTETQISNSYVIPYYDTTDLTKYNSFQIANVDSISTNVLITIGGVLKGTYPLGVGGSQNVTYPNTAGGPVVISSDNGAKIIGSLYELKRSGTSGLFNGQNQMVGLPSSQLSDTYVLTRYNSTLNDLLPYVLFAVP